MKVDQMTKTTPADNDVWVLRNPSHRHHQRLKQGNKNKHFFFLFQVLYYSNLAILVLFNNSIEIVAIKRENCHYNFVHIIDR
jgi:hypothetical protein